jgi:hypothetical protein
MSLPTKLPKPSELHPWLLPYSSASSQLLPQIADRPGQPPSQSDASSDHPNLISEHPPLLTEADLLPHNAEVFEEPPSVTPNISGEIPEPQLASSQIPIPSHSPLVEPDISNPSISESEPRQLSDRWFQGEDGMHRTIPVTDVPLWQALEHAHHNLRACLTEREFLLAALDGTNAGIAAINVLLAQLGIKRRVNIFLN